MIKKKAHDSLIFSVLINHGAFCIEDQIEGLFAWLQSSYECIKTDDLWKERELRELIDGVGA